MALQVFTARLSRKLVDPDLFDITRAGAARARGKGLPAPGDPFAPSWAILGPALRVRDEAAALMGQAHQEVRRGGDGLELVHRSVQIEEEAWARYAPLYREEMLESYREHRAAWGALLARPRVVLACTCLDSGHCHRTLLAGFLGKLGADVRGELCTFPRYQQEALKL